MPVKKAEGHECCAPCARSGLPYPISTRMRPALAGCGTHGTAGVHGHPLPARFTDRPLEFPARIVRPTTKPLTACHSSIEWRFPIACSIYCRLRCVSCFRFSCRCCLPHSPRQCKLATSQYLRYRALCLFLAQPAGAVFARRKTVPCDAGF